MSSRDGICDGKYVCILYFESIPAKKMHNFNDSSAKMKKKSQPEITEALAVWIRQRENTSVCVTVIKGLILSDLRDRSHRLLAAFAHRDLN